MLLDVRNKIFEVIFPVMEYILYRSIIFCVEIYILMILTFYFLVRVFTYTHITYILCTVMNCYDTRWTGKIIFKRIFNTVSCQFIRFVGLKKKHNLLIPTLKNQYKFLNMSSIFSCTCVNYSDNMYTKYYIIYNIIIILIYNTWLVQFLNSVQINTKPFHNHH